MRQFPLDNIVRLFYYAYAHPILYLRKVDALEKQYACPGRRRYTMYKRMPLGKADLP